ncbi:hypothetical protein HHK36_019949 [Tetracentron sinense]|uniref:Reticulon-like protein n=1 Tax=Tetracentron sinense TaxID=13715 RepID=A0A835D8D6_TETSI|nr:hypothetical protein HHK36_019949 [Tetracentron sinense]
MLVSIAYAMDLCCKICFQEITEFSCQFIIGNGENICDFTYIENIAHAYIRAEEALGSEMASVAGKAFFITNLEPMKFWEFASLILEGLGYQRPSIQLPARMVWFILVLSKWMHKKLGLTKHDYSVLTPTVHLLSRTRTFNCSASQKHFGYSPVVSQEEGVTLTIKSFSHLAKESFPARYRDFSELSKAEKLLSSGRVADILLWRDEKKTFTYFLTLVLLFYWFFLSGRPLISSTARLLLLFSVILFGHGILPSSMCGFTIQKISSSYFEVSETVIEDAIITVAYAWNRGVHTLRSLAQGDDWNLFFKVAASLYFFKLLLSFSFSNVIGVALVFAFTAFFVYEQYEEEVIRVARASSTGTKLMGLLMKNLPAYVVSLLQNYKILGQNEEPAAVKGRQHGP